MFLYDGRLKQPPEEWRISCDVRLDWSRLSDHGAGLQFQAPAYNPPSGNLYCAVDIVERECCLATSCKCCVLEQHCYLLGARSAWERRKRLHIRLKLFGILEPSPRGELADKQQVSDCGALA